MATKFEFLPRAQRRLPLDWRLPGVFVVLLLLSVLLSTILRFSADRLQRHLDQQSQLIEGRRRELMSGAWALVPDPATVSTVHQDIVRHNFSLIGEQPLWSDFFTIFEEDLPPTAVIVKVENPHSGTSGFASSERDFLLQVMVPDNETSNQLFSRLSARKSLQSLSFTPKGEAAFQGRKGIAIEIVFHLEAGS